MKSILFILIFLFAINLQSQTSCAACFGTLDKNISVDAGIPPAGFAFSYLWSTGPITKDIDVTIPGLYTVTVTLTDSSLFCPDVIEIHTFDVIELAIPICTINAPVSICAGDPFQLTETGGEALAWLWTTSGIGTFDFPTSSMPTITGAVDGDTINVLITDFDFCQTNCEYIVSTITCPLLMPTIQENKTVETTNETFNLFAIIGGCLILILFVWERSK